MNFLMLALFFHSAYSFDYGMNKPHSKPRNERISLAVLETASSFSDDFPLSDEEKKNLRYSIELTLYRLDKASNWNDLTEMFRRELRALRWESVFENIANRKPMADVKGTALIFISQMLARKHIESLSYDAPYFSDPQRELVNVSRNVAVVFSFFGLLSVIGFDSLNFFRDQLLAGVSPWIIARASQYFRYLGFRKNFSDTLLMGKSIREIVLGLSAFAVESPFVFLDTQTLLNDKEIRRIWTAYRSMWVCDDALSGFAF